MSFSGELLQLVEELRGVTAVGRTGDQQELRRIVRVVSDDIREMARKAKIVEANPKADVQWIRSVRARFEKAANEAAVGIAATAFGDAFDPHGWFVYLLWGDDPEIPLYVGQSRNVLGRLGGHLQDPDKNPHVRQVALIRCDDRDAMHRTEWRLIRHYQPPWNTVGILPDDELAWSDPGTQHVDPLVVEARYGPI